MQNFFNKKLETAEPFNWACFKHGFQRFSPWMFALSVLAEPSFSVLYECILHCVSARKLWKFQEKLINNLKVILLDHFRWSCLHSGSFKCEKREILSSECLFLKGFLHFVNTNNPFYHLTGPSRQQFSSPPSSRNPAVWTRGFRSIFWGGCLKLSMSRTF